MTSEKNLFKKGLFFVPLGGADEIGMNMNLYAYNDAWICVDLGVSFSDQAGIELVMPDPTFIQAKADKLLGLVLTHAHEDHLGAVPHLWQKLRCPIYATPFTEVLLRAKLKEAGLLNQVTIHTIPLGGNIKLGPFDIDLVSITHSILEPNLLAIKTPVGTIVHTGDWKFDETPRLGEATDKAILAQLGKQKILAMVCDSTNIFEPNLSGSEEEVFEGLKKIFQAYTQERLVVTCFASNLARVHSIATLARDNGRHCALVGRSLDKMVDAARQTGYLGDLPPFLEPEKARYLPRNEVVYITTGSQGEPRAALTRIAEGIYPNVDLEPGDVVVFSSRRIPGNERKISALQNALIDQGLEVIFPNRLMDLKLHVSGHPSQGELKEMYRLIKPQIAIPVHGDALHLRAHEELALSLEIPTVLVPYNGAILRLDPDPDVVGEVVTQRLVLDGKDLLPEDSFVLKERLRMAGNGTGVITLVMDEEDTLVQQPQITLHGLIHEEDIRRHDRVLDKLSKAIVGQIDQIPYAKRRNDGHLIHAIETIAKRTISQLMGKKPLIDVHIVRI